MMTYLVPPLHAFAFQRGQPPGKHPSDETSQRTHTSTPVDIYCIRKYGDVFLLNIYLLVFMDYAQTTPMKKN